MLFHTLVFLAGFALARLGGMGGPVPLEVGPETTVIVEPRLEDGRMDYAAALNARLSEGVEPGENGYADLLAVTRVEPDLAAAEAEAWEMLGVEPPGEDATRLPGKQVDDRSTQDPWTAEDLPDVSQVIEEGEAALDRLVAASEKAAYWAPIVSRDEPGMLGAVYIALGPSRHHLVLLSARAQRHVALGELDAAWADLLAAKRWARKIATEPFVISRLVAYSIEARAREATLDLLSSSELTPELARRVQRDLVALPPLPGAADAVDLGERLMVLDAMQFLALAPPEKLRAMNDAIGPVLRVRPGHFEEVGRAHDFRRFWNVNTSLRAANELLDAQVAAMREADPRRRMDLFQVFERRLDDRFAEGRVLLNPRVAAGMVLRPRTTVSRVMTDLMLSIFMPALTSADSVYRKTEAGVMLEGVAAAAAVYAAEHDGRYPPKLGDLVPGYLKEVPHDPWTGEPLHYRNDAEGVLIWSVGPDFIDDRGVERGVRHGGAQGGDVSVRLGAAAATEVLDEP